jgi:hypothetical protein
MERGSLDKLKFDKRLRLRHGWSADAETENYLAALPDVSDKIAVETDEPETESVSETDAPPASIVAPGEQSLGESSSSAGEIQAVSVDTGSEDPGNSTSAPPFKEV